MIYNLNKEEDIQGAKAYFERLAKLKKKIELKEVRKKISGQQNAYLHLLFRWFSLESGYDTETVKTEFFKKLCNEGLFITEVAGSLGKYQRIKSVTELDTLEISVAIERFRNWAVNEAGIYLPEPNEEQFLDHIKNEIEKYENAKYL